MVGKESSSNETATKSKSVVKAPGEILKSKPKVLIKKIKPPSRGKPGIRTKKTAFDNAQKTGASNAKKEPTQTAVKSPAKTAVKPTITKPNGGRKNPVDSQEIQRLTRKVENLEQLIEISRQFSSTLNFKKLMKSIFETVLRIMDAEAGSFWVPDNKKKEILCSIAEGPAKDKVIGLRLQEGQGIVGWAMQQKQNAVIFDASKDERFSKSVDQKTKFVTKSMLCVPLLVNEECVGAIQIINKKTEDGQFSQLDLDMLEDLGNSGAIAIRNAKLYQSEQRVKELNTLLNFSKELTSTLDLDQVLLSIVNLSSQVINYSRAVVALLDENDRVLLAAESNQAQPDLRADENIRLKEVFDYVLSSGNSQYITNFDAEEPQEHLPELLTTYMTDFNLRSLNVIILSDSEGKLGLISMEGSENTLVGAQSQYIINMLINQGTVAIRNAQLYQNIPTSTIAEKFKSGFHWTRKTTRQFLMTLSLIALVSFAALYLPYPSNVTADVEVIPNYKTQVTAIDGGVVKQVLFQEGDRVRQGQPLLLFDSSELVLEKRKLEKDLQIAQTDLMRLIQEDKIAEIFMKQLQIEKLENQLLLIDKKLEHVTVVATREGVILTERPEELLDKQVKRGEIIAEIAYDNKKEALLHILEEDVLKIEPGDRVSLTLQALPGIVIDGELGMIAPDKTETEEEEEFPYYIAYLDSPLLNETPDIKFGMTGKAKIHLESKTVFKLFLEPSISKLVTRIKLQFFL